MMLPGSTFTRASAYAPFEMKRVVFELFTTSRTLLWDPRYPISAPRMGVGRMPNRTPYSAPSSDGAANAWSYLTAPPWSVRDSSLSARAESGRDRKSTRLNSSHDQISYAVF